ncbi:MAG: YfhO family protein [Candidatus Levyibacteriota bacterium]
MLKNLKIHWPLLLVFLLWGIFSSPFFFKGLVPFPSKYQVTFFAPWNAYPEYAGPVKNNATPDVVGQIYPWKLFTIDTYKHGQIPFWNPYSFSGTPHLANYQSAVLSPFNLGFFVLPVIDWWSFMVLLQPLLAGVGMYLYIKSLKLSAVSQAVSSVSFMFCGFITTWMMYETLGFAILFLPYALYAIERYLSSKKIRFLLLLFFTIPLSFFSGHFQISIYFFLFIVLYLLFKFFSVKSKKDVILLGAAVLLGLFASGAQIFPSIELYGQSLRSGIFEKVEAIRWEYVQALFAPDFFGNPVTRNDWFGHYAEWNGYVGVIPLLLALYAFLGKRKKEILFFGGVGLGVLLLAYQTPLLDLLIALKIPVLSTSAASRIIVLFSFCASVLAGFGIEHLVEDIKKNHYRNTYSILVFGIFVFLLLWMQVFLKVGVSLETPAFPLNKYSIAKSNLLFPSLIFFGFLTALIIIRFFKKRTGRKIALGLLIILLCIDVFRFASKWQPFDPKKLVFPSTGVSKFVEKIQGPDRYFANFGAEGLVAYHLPGVEGYDAVYIRRYGQFIASLDDGKLKDSYRSVVQFPKTGKYALPAANLLGVRYFIHKISDGQQVWEFPFWEYDPKSLRLLFDDGHYQVLENTNAFPRAFLVKNVIPEQDPQKILDKMFSSDMRKTAVVEGLLNSGDGSGSAQIVSYTPDLVQIKTEANKSSFLVLTDSYLPGWKAAVDGKETKIFRTDFTFRGVEVPAGSHLVTFSYVPPSFLYGIAAGIMSLLGLFSLVYLIRRIHL